MEELRLEAVQQLAENGANEKTRVRRGYSCKQAAAFEDRMRMNHQNDGDYC